MIQWHLLAIAVCSAAIATTNPAATEAQGAPIPLERRPLTLPRLHPGDACPITTGARDTVPHQPHIFGASGVWFGSGPVYFSLAWKASSDNNATFALKPVPHEGHAYRAKTPWVSVPSYAGPILIRGQSLDGRRPLRFDATGAGPADKLLLQAPQAPAPSLWSFWPSSMWVPAAGCYGVQIDSLSGTEKVVFEAT